MKSESVKDGFAVAKDASEATKGLLNEAKPVFILKEIQSFREALEELLEEMGITLVVFVDDLDRCLPKTAISTLEAIRLLLFLRRSAFVIAADDVFIRGAVRVHFAGTGLDDDVATNYFDKLIQVPLRVPRLGSNETKAYTALLFLERAHRSGQLDVVNFEKAKASVEARLRETWTGKAVDLAFLETLVPEGDAELLGLMGLAERLAPLLFSASTVQANPRLIKRFLNTVFLRKALAKPQNIDVDVKIWPSGICLSVVTKPRQAHWQKKYRPKVKEESAFFTTQKRPRKIRNARFRHPSETNLLCVSGCSLSRCLVTWICGPFCISAAIAP